MTRIRVQIDIKGKGSVLSYQLINCDNWIVFALRHMCH